jgi:F0F1-type ATP synthase assembly protein I
LPAVEPPEALHVTPEKKVGEAEGWSRAIRDSAPFVGMGLALAVTLLLAVGGGYWVDKKLGTSPLFVLAGAVFGLLAVFYHVYKAYKMGDRR